MPDTPIGQAGVPNRDSRWPPWLALSLGLVLIAIATPLGRWLGHDDATPMHALRPGQTDEQFYFIVTDRFANGDPGNDTGGLNGDRMTTGFDPTDTGFYHGGDLAGIMAHLDYIQGLGTTAIWLTPTFVNQPVQGTGRAASAGYHGYWITDFTRIDPHLGTEDELRQLIAAVHRRGMRIYFDIVVNHTADVIDYADGSHSYRPKSQSPYRDASGQVIDDAQLAATRQPFPALDADSFAPHRPVIDPARSEARAPGWLNDPTMYHNRGDSTWVGESVTYGDFHGLDDVFTERPEVVSGFTEIYQAWQSWGIDGFRIDTVKHVNIEFWQQFCPALQASGGPEFFMFGEVFTTDVEQTSRFTTRGRLPAALDFAFQAAAVQVANMGSPRELVRVWDQDDYLIDADSGPYQSPTFLGNHDLGRIGMLVAGTPDQRLSRDLFAHSLLLLTRGQPVIYYGDEQGLTGSGGDQAARADLFATRTERYATDQVLGGPPGSLDRYDPTHRLYRHLADLAGLRQAHPALVNGAQMIRYADESAGLLVTSRIAAGREYVVVANNSAETHQATVRTDVRETTLTPIFGGGEASPVAADGTAQVSAEPMSVRVYQAERGLPARQAAPTAAIEPIDASRPQQPIPIEAALSQPAFAEVSFLVRPAGSSDWQLLGTDDAPNSETGRYRVFADLSNQPTGTPMEVRVVVTDGSGNVSHTEGSFTVGG